MMNNEPRPNEAVGKSRRFRRGSREFCAPVALAALGRSAVGNRRSRSVFRQLLWAVLLTLPHCLLQAQTTPPPAQDPLMSLMLSQPKIDITAPVTATAAFDPPVVRPGEESIYRVTFNALAESVAWPDKLNGTSGLEIKQGARGEMLRLAGASYAPLSAFNYRVRPERLGEFSIPAFEVNVYGKSVKVPAARLEVVSAPTEPGQPTPLIYLETPATNLFVGQAVRVRVLMPGTAAGAQGLAQAQVSGPGILVDLGGVRQHYESLPHRGTRVPTYVYETTLTPIVTGKLSVYAQGFFGSPRLIAPLVINGAGIMPSIMPQFMLLESEPVELVVRPLPPEGELPGFTGGIGNFTLGPPKLGAPDARVGDAINLAVTVTNRGDGPCARLVAPPAPRARDWQVFPPTEVAPAQPVVLVQPGTPFPTQSLEGVTTFNYTLIPLAAEARFTPAIPFSYFDPKRGAYADLTIPAVPVSVKPGAVPGDLQALAQSETPPPGTEKEAALGGLASSPGRRGESLVLTQQQTWFPLIQVFPAAMFGGLWLWDRRRRYLEAHPEVLVRRRARRALRRQRRAMRAAAQARDASGFAAAAVNAMRAGCAPHYPAEPRALVGSDVLAVVGEAGQGSSSGDVVRRFFAVTDASRFAIAGGDATELLGLAPEMEHVLRRIEEGL